MEVEYKVIPARRAGNMPGTSYHLTSHELETELTNWKREGFLFVGMNDQHIVLERVTDSSQV